MLNHDEVKSLIDAKSIILKYGYIQDRELWSNDDDSKTFSVLSSIISKELLLIRKEKLGI